MNECICMQVLLNDNAFDKALHRFVFGRESEMLRIMQSEQEPNLYSLLLLIDFIFEMFHDCGMSVIYRVYKQIRDRSDVEFQNAEGWHECVLSHVPSQQCLLIDADTAVHEQYSKWVHCLWLITHIRQIENERSARVPEPNVQLYQTSFLFIFKELQRLYNDLQISQT